MEEADEPLFFYFLDWNVDVFGDWNWIFWVGRNLE